MFLAEYAGPFAITALLALMRRKSLSQKQILGTVMVLGHYAKRLLETVFVHRFSAETMPLSNLFKNCSHYWLLFGFNMYQFLKPQPSNRLTKTDLVLTLSFAIFELLNLKTHLILKNLRRPGTTERGIPCNYGFNQVSCANYLWETCAWTSYALLAKNSGAWLFLGVSGAQMLQWAKKKHARYRKEFADYPRHRKSFIPYLI